MTADLSRLRPVAVRDVWKYEDRDFTTWLLENADVLADVLGMEIELTRAEHQVGGFRLDLIGQTPGNQGVVIVENQLEQTDHSHLGQILTYAGGTSPSTIVWCAPSFRDEHRAALDWLNEHTDEDTRFFGVEVSAVQIDSSRPAPLFRLVAQPNDWAKQVHADQSKGASQKSALYATFWAELLGELRAKHPDWTRGITSNQPWVTMSTGRPGVLYQLNFPSSGPRVELYFNSPDSEANRIEYERHLAHRGDFERVFGGPLTYDPMDGYKACRIYCARPEAGDISEVSKHAEAQQWLVGTLERFRPAAFHVRDQIDAELAGIL
ncbi:MAG: DUF4268 domain-containing protein [Propionicimonas sp.]